MDSRIDHGRRRFVAREEMHEERRRGWEGKRLQVEVVRRVDCRSPTFDLTFQAHEMSQSMPRGWLVRAAYRLLEASKTMRMFQFCTKMKKQNSSNRWLYGCSDNAALVGCRGYAQSFMHDLLHACELKLQSCIASLQTWSLRGLGGTSTPSRSPHRICSRMLGEEERP